MAKKELTPRKDLTPRQLKAAVLEANPENWNLTQVARAEQVGVSRKTLLRWQKLPAYREYKRNLIREHAEGYMPKAWACLGKRMEVDTQAIKLYFSLMGQYQEPGTGTSITFAFLANLPDEELDGLLQELEG